MGVKKFDKWCEERKITVDLKTTSAILRKCFAEAPLSRNINILQDSEFISANKMFEAKAKLFTKQCETKTQIIYSVRRCAEIETILHGRAEQGQRLEKCGEVG